MQRVVRSIISPAGGLRDRVALFTGREYAKGIAEKKKNPAGPNAHSVCVAVFADFADFSAF